jgi:hypothetical protein
MIILLKCVMKSSKFVYYNYRNRDLTQWAQINAIKAKENQ